MWYIKATMYVAALAAMLSSCELFGGGGGAGGEVVWRLANATSTLVGTQPLIDDGVVYFVQDERLKAHRLSDGERLWSRRTGNPNYGRALLEDGNKVFLDEGLTIQAHRKSDGALLWETWLTEEAADISGIGSPVMSQDEQYLYAGRKGYVVQLRKADGRLTRRYPLERLVPEGVTQGATEPVISPFGEDILYVPTHYYDRTTPGEEEFGANLFAFEASTGELEWETRVEYKIDNYLTDVPGDSVVVSPPIYDIEVTRSSIVALQGKAIVVLNRSDGSIRWVKNFPVSGFDVGLAVEGNGIYAASVGNYAHRLDLQSGEEIWRRDITYSNTSIPTVRDGRLYFNNSGGGGIWVLDAADGAVIYHENTPNYRRDDHDVYISSLGVGEGYMVNVGSKAVYCLRVP